MCLTSVESIYEDAQGAPDGISSSESVAEKVPFLSEIANSVDQPVHETDQNVHEIDQNVHETDHHEGYGTGEGPAHYVDQSVHETDQNVHETDHVVLETDHHEGFGTGEGPVLVDKTGSGSAP